MITLKFEVSETSLLDSKVIIDKIQVMLKNENYIVQNITANKIAFKDDNWEMRSKSSTFRKVDRGTFIMVSKNKITSISYLYYITFLPELIITMIILVVAFVVSPLALITALPLWMQLAVRIYTLKNVSKLIIKRLAT